MTIRAKRLLVYCPDRHLDERVLWMESDVRKYESWCWCKKKHRIVTKKILVAAYRVGGVTAAAQVAESTGWSTPGISRRLQRARD